MLVGILIAIAFIALVAVSARGLLLERKKKIDKRALSMGMESIFGTEKSK